MTRKQILTLVVASASLALLVQCGAPANTRGNGRRPAPGTLFMYPERIQLAGGGFAEAERGMLFVPVNRSNPESDVIGIEIYRFKATEKASNKTPPIFALHGGPSFEGLEPQLAELGTFEARWQPYLDIADLVVISQRGIGPSKPTTAIDVTTTPPPLDADWDEDRAVEEFRDVCTKERDFWRSRGLDLSGFTVIEAAADVDDVREALGYDTFQILGGSFGSHWGMAVMRYYPDTVERAIFFGMEGPDHTYDHPGHIWNVYKRVAEEAEQVEELKPRISEGGLIAAITSVMERIEAEPVEVSVTDPKTGDARTVLFSPRSFAGSRLARGFSGDLHAWPADVIRLHGGDFQGAAEAMIAMAGADEWQGITASFFMLDCGSGITPRRLAEYRADPAVDLIGMLGWEYFAGCPVWESDLGDDFRQNFSTDIPTVIVHGTWDTSTPWENAVELTPYFTKSKLIPVIRGPHPALFAAMAASPEFTESIFEFAANGDMSGLPDQFEMPPEEWVVPDTR